MNISIIIPAYNEQKRLKKTLDSIFAYGMSYPANSYEIIVVNDASIDDTPGLVRMEMARVPTNITLDLINHVHNQGKGAAVATGIRVATGEVILFMDADGSTHIHELDKLLPYLAAGSSVVIGSRYAANARVITKQLLARNLLSKVFRILVRMLFPIGVLDTQNGFKLFTADAAKAIFSQLTTTGWAFDVEVLARARKLEYKVSEVGIEWRNDERSQVRFGGMVKMLIDIIRLRIELLIS